MHFTRDIGRAKKELRLGDETGIHRLFFQCTGNYYRSRYAEILIWIEK